jgi:serine/threonine protein kinase
VTDLTGTTVRNLRFVSLLGRVGPIEIYEATSHDRPCQIEVYDVLVAEDIIRVLHGARIAARLPFELVVPLLDSSRLDDGRPYLQRELLAGTLLSQLVPQPPQRARELVRLLVECVGAIHDQGIAIGDLRCERVFVETAPEGERVRLWDLRFASPSDMTSDATRDDLTRCVGILYELVTGARATADPDADNAPAFAALFRRAFDGSTPGFATADELLAALAGEDGVAPAKLPVARLLPKKK